MSGVEVAGLVLGALPLLLAGLQFYGEGIAVTKRYWKYREEVNSLLDDLKAESAVYQNSIETLLLGVVDSRDVTEFLANPGGELWKAAAFERKLRKRLGASYDPYLSTILKLRNTAEAFKERLKLSDSGQAFHAFKEHYKRLKFSLSKSDYADLMNTFRNANTVLHRLTFQRQNIESQQRRDRFPCPDFQTINEGAKGFFSVLSSGWTCQCQAAHAVSLRLEPRMEDVSSDDEVDEDHGFTMRDPFHVLFQYGYRDTVTPSIDVSPWDWDEADIHVIRGDLASKSTCRMNSGKGVRFASEARKAVKAALQPEANLQLIKDLCTALQNLQKPQRDVCLTLLAKEIAKQKYELKIYPTPLPPQDTKQWTVVTLRSALKRGRRFPKRDRVRLAVTLASSVLQLHETPWLDDSWGIDNIYFVERPGSNAYDQPFVLRGLDPILSTLKESVPKHLSRMIQNRPLFALGVTLIELWYGKSLTDLHEDEDGPHGTGDAQIEFITKLNTAYRLADELADDAGAKYSDAVRRCIRCDFSLRANSLEDVELQKAVFHGVVSQLKATQDFMG
ncbi:hypothetical protein E8E13_008963 [Curvularia kusanoi]|uniref:DUF7580 domain-containing protein n=1 Tax=Curvularia kusanoi TaxID=90978 RepID=A0A9P4TD94_CURKU|nr:hypothetical protein E8E13_008963 [Curvularia kusanoi]